VAYSGTGTHALYPTAGNQPYVLPFGILKDKTDAGPLWDPLQNLYAYHWNTSLADGSDRSIRVWDPDSSAPPVIPLLQRHSEDFDKNIFTPASNTPSAPTSWFHFSGHWGDKVLRASDPRQYHFFSEKAHGSGPPGPKFKALGREHICFYLDGCVVKESIYPMWWVLKLLVDCFIVCVILGGLAVIILSTTWLTRKALVFFRTRGLGRPGVEEEEGPVDERAPLLRTEDRASPSIVG
jgi:hypothetical protein